MVTDGATVGELSRHILELIAQSSSEAVIVVDADPADAEVAYVNPAFEELTGYGAEEVVGRPWRLLAEPSGDSADVDALRAAMAGGEEHVATLPDVAKDGNRWLCRVRARPILDKRGKLERYLILQTELPAPRRTGLEVGLLQRELGRARKKVATLDRVDPATGLLRYQSFLDVAGRDCRIARRYKERVAVAVIGVNDLDAYEQTFGAKAAESCLRMIAAQVTGALRRSGDLCGCEDGRRIVAFTRGQSADQLGRVAERIAANVRGLALHNPRGRSGRYITVSSATAECVPSADDSLSALIEEAHAKLCPVHETARRSFGG